MHAILSYRGNRPIHPQANRQDRLQYTAPQLARSVIITHLLVAIKCQHIYKRSQNTRPHQKHMQQIYHVCKIITTK